MELFPLYLSALLLGTAHAMEPDHLAAVTAFVVRGPRPLQAAGFGAKWALGHGAAIFLVGFGLLLVGHSIPNHWTTMLDRTVGLVMIGLGFWTFSNARTLHSHSHVHADGTSHTHMHGLSGHHDHPHAATAMGILHGLAGTGPAVALIPLLSLRSARQGALYLLLFGLGTAGGMASYALIAGTVAGRLNEASDRIGIAVTRTAGVVAFGVGIMWVLR